MLYGIHQNVHEHGFTFSSVNICNPYRRIKFSEYMYSFRTLFLDYVFYSACYPLVELCRLHPESALADFKLSQVKDHIQKIAHAL